MAPRRSPVIPARTFNSIRRKLDFVELIREQIEVLVPVGRNFKCRCPFHKERGMSCIISPERQTFHCFGCGEGGDAVTFVMKLERLSFLEAVKKLAARTGVKLSSSLKR